MTSYTVMRARNPEMVREWNRRGDIRKHGIEPQDYDELLAQQGGVCALCARERSAKRRLCIDHDHDHCAGEYGCRECIRGLLCTACNIHERKRNPDTWAAYIARPRPFAGVPSP